MNSIGDQIQDKVIMADSRKSSSNRGFNGTPMKILIAQEMSNELQSRHSPPNLVAKLMGLDTFPGDLPGSPAEIKHSRGHSWNHSVIQSENWQKERSNSEPQMQCENHQYLEHNKFKGFYDIWKLSQKVNTERNKSPQREVCSDNFVNEKKMALVRQKFSEAKSLATDENLRQSKQFQDALEVLSSNKDLFLKFLQEPDSLFSQHFNDLWPSPPPEMKRITILKPSKVVNNEKFVTPAKRNEKDLKQVAAKGQLNAWRNPECVPPYASREVNSNTAQHTRIVVLKPNPGKSDEAGPVVLPPSTLPEVSPCRDVDEDPEEEVQVSSEDLEETKCQMPENLNGQPRDETIFSSVFSSGYIGDASSFNKSEIEYPGGNFCDLEVMSPTSRYSWDYINRISSPYSSSFSRASYSPESSVCREAKKRLSERWAMMICTGSQEQRHLRRSSSTLGEMLALSDVKNSLRSEVQCIQNDLEPKESSSSTTNNPVKIDRADASDRNLLRSKSVPASATGYGVRLNEGVSDCERKAVDASKRVSDARSTRMSFKDKVSSLFFSRNKKSSGNKTSASQSTNESSASIVASQSLEYDDNRLRETDSRECVRLSELGSTIVSPQGIASVEQNHLSVFPRVDSSATKPAGIGSLVENQDHPSPVSVLEALFDEDGQTTSESAGNVKLERHGGVPFISCKSNLIDKSPPIGSIPRTLTWDDSCVDTAASCPLATSLSSREIEEEKQEWFIYVQSLLSAAGFDGEVQWNSFMIRWHSPDCPLDPSLRDKDAFLFEKDSSHEAKRRQRRSTQKLVFDLVNAALVDIAGYGSDACPSAITCGGADNGLRENSSFMVVDLVWEQLRKWFSGEVRCGWNDGGDGDSLVRKEVVGISWVDQSRLEMDDIGQEIEGKLLEELVNDAVIELIHCV